MIEIENLTYRYSNVGRPVLNKLSLTVETGETLCLMGANGSGKSTLARILAGLIKDYSGTVTINDQAAGSREAAGQVGILFQDPDNQMVATIVEKEIAFALENLAVPLAAMQRLVNEQARVFHIEHLIQRLTSELSGGEKQRVALASLMIRKPPVLILDEPDSYLDNNGRKILECELDRIRQHQGRITEIRITQYPAVAMACSRLVILQCGAVAADGEPKTIFADKQLIARTGLSYSVEKPNTISIPGWSVDDVEAASPVEHRIEMKRVSFGYTLDGPIIDNLSFELNRGEIVAVVGPTGSGKSSLGLLLCGVLKAWEGTIGFTDQHGRRVVNRMSAGKVVGLFQQPERQFFLTSCAAEVSFGPGNLGYRLSQEELQAYFEMAGLDWAQFAERDPFTLSVGEKRRLAFAAVLSMSPSFVVFDEPTCALDPEGVGRFLAMARRLKECGVGQVLITHDGDIIKLLADRALWLTGDGRAVDMSVDQLLDSRDHAPVVSRLSVAPEHP